MKSTLLTLVLFAALAAGCGANPPAPTRIYDFGLAPDAAGTPVSVHVQKIDAPDWLDRRDMLYRLAYRNPQALEPYALSRWAGTPPALLTLRIRQALGNPAPRDARCSLHVSLQEFSQVFASASASEAVLQATAVLRERNGDQRRQSLQLRLRRAADTPDAQGGAGAFSHLADELTGRLRDWIVAAGYCG